MGSRVTHFVTLNVSWGCRSTHKPSKIVAAPSSRCTRLRLAHAAIWNWARRNRAVLPVLALRPYLRKPWLGDRGALYGEQAVGAGSAAGQPQGERRTVGRPRRHVERAADQAGAFPQQ